MSKFHDDPEHSARVRAMERYDLAVVAGLIERLARQRDARPRLTHAVLETDLFGVTPRLYGLVVERFGYVVGYALMTPLHCTQFGECELDLRQLFVLQGSRGLGLGRKLVDGVIAFAQNTDCQRIVTGASGDSLCARRFYEAVGFLPRESGAASMRAGSGDQNARVMPISTLTRR